MSEYYTVTTDFGGVDPNIGQLHQEIVDYMLLNPGNISQIFYGITSYTSENDTIIPFAPLGERIVQVLFENTLTPGEKTILNSLISGHIPVFIVSTNNILNITSIKDTVTNNSYIRVNKPILVPGMSYARAEIISYMATTGDSYDVRIFDKTNLQILAEVNLTNTTETSQSLGVLSNLSTEPWILEISIKQNGVGSKKIYVESINIFYN